MEEGAGVPEGEEGKLCPCGTAGWTEWNNDNPQNLIKRLCWRELAARVLEHFPRPLPEEWPEG